MVEPNARVVFFSLGSNLGDRLAALQRGLEVLGGQPGIRLQAVSSVYETDPVGGPEQDDFLNIVALAESNLPPAELLRAAQSAEEELHRVRKVRWGPRTLDVDIIDIEGVTSADPQLTLPHPRALERAFVLVPLAELAPRHTLAGDTSPAAELLAALPPSAKTGVRPRPDLLLHQP